MSERKADDMLVTLTRAELAELVKVAAADGARLVANELRDPLLPLSEFCKRFDVHRNTVQAAVERGDLHPERKGGSGRGRSTLIRESEGLRWLRSKTGAA